MMSLLLPQFKKYIWSEWGSKEEWENKFLSLSDLQQKAVVELLQNGLTVTFVYDAILHVDVNDLLLRDEETLNNISEDYLSRSAW